MSPALEAYILTTIGAQRLAGTAMIPSADLYRELVRSGVAISENQLERRLLNLRDRRRITMLAFADPADVATYGRFLITSVAPDVLDALLPDISPETRAMIVQRLR
jgi:hypothetical protein